MDQAIKLADEVFCMQDQASMGSGFPFIFSGALRQSYGAFENGKIVAFAGLVPQFIRTGNACLPVMSLGAVCTHPDARGRGYASRLMEQIRTHAERAGAVLLLVSGDRSMYLKMGCASFGAVTKYSLVESGLESLEHRPVHTVSNIREWEATDWLHLQEAAAARPVRYEQSVTDMAILVHAQAYAGCALMEHKVVVSGRPDGTIDAFLVLTVPDGRRTPLVMPRAIEWAGEASAVGSLLAYAMRNYSLPQLDVIVPWQEENLHKALAMFPKAEEKNAGTVLILDSVRLLNQLRASREDVEPLQAKAQSDGDFVLEWADGKRVRLTLPQWTALLFDPGYIERTPFLAESVGNRLSGMFPVPLPYTSGLNFV